MIEGYFFILFLSWKDQDVRMRKELGVCVFTPSQPWRLYQGDELRKVNFPARWQSHDPGFKKMTGC